MGIGRHGRAVLQGGGHLAGVFSTYTKEWKFRLNKDTDGSVDCTMRASNQKIKQNKTKKCDEFGLSTIVRGSVYGLC